MSEPLRSMTGAGAFSLESDHGRFDIDTRSVNHRFLKTSVRIHGALPALDSRVEGRVKRRVDRGHVTVHVRFQPAPGSALEARVDAAAFARAAEQLAHLAQAAELEPPRVADVLLSPGVLSDPRGAYDAEILGPLFDRAVDGAIDQLVASRETEGGFLRTEIDGLLDGIAASAAKLAGRATEVPGLAQERLERRLEALLEGKGLDLDPESLAREVSILADRSDVTEEIARLGAHVAHARELVLAGGPVGRRLDFLVQELHRETNTVSSKAGDLDLTRLAMDLKSGIERLREQVANLE